MQNRLTMMTAVMFVMILSLVGLPAPAPATYAQTDELCFAETGYCISGRIRQYWQLYGGLPVFGFPISAQGEAQIEDQVLTVQWFERNRLELHPANPRPFDVLIGRIGVERLEQQGRDWQAFPRETAERSGCRFFPETGQNVCGEILAAWRANGLELDGVVGFVERENLALYGLPISPVVEEELDGRRYQVQWFERARFELHPENAPPFNVLLGRLGAEVRNAASVSTDLLVDVRGDDFAFVPERLNVASASRVNITFLNSAQSYPHNWVLLNTSDLSVAQEFNTAAGRAGRANNFLPPDQSLVLAASTVLNPGAAEVISFTTPIESGDYLYICTVPGHFAAGMYGILSVR